MIHLIMSPMKAPRLLNAWGPDSLIQSVRRSFSTPTFSTSSGTPVFTIHEPTAPIKSPRALNAGGIACLMKSPRRLRTPPSHSSMKTLRTLSAAGMILSIKNDVSLLRIGSRAIPTRSDTWLKATLILSVSLAVASAVPPT